MGILVNPMAPYAPAQVGDTVVLKVGEMASVLNTPAEGLVARTAVWLLDFAGTEIIGGTVYVPPFWRLMNVDLYWCAVTGTGDASFRCDVGAITAGAAVPDPPAGTQVTATAAAGTTTVVTRMATNMTAPDGLTAIEVIRLGGDVADTLASDAGVIAVVLSRSA